MVKHKNNNTKNLLKDGVTIEDIDNYLKKNTPAEKIITSKIISYRQMCRDILKFSNTDLNNKNKILNYINFHTSSSTINNVIKSLAVNCFIDKNITYQSFLDSVNKYEIMDNFII